MSVEQVTSSDVRPASDDQALPAGGAERIRVLGTDLQGAGVLFGHDDHARFPGHRRGSALPHLEQKLFPTGFE